LTSPANPNLNFYPDFYSYNFDIINLLVLPLDRKSVFAQGHYEISSAVDVFVQGGYTEYTSQNALAPTPVGVTIRNPARASATQAGSNLLNNTCPTSANPNAPCSITGLLVPIDNPFVPADLATLLASRSGDDPALVGTGADEPIKLNYRFLPTGLRVSNFDTGIWQVLAGVRGDIAPGWRYEAYASYGKTVIDTRATGNVNVQKVQQLLEASDGGASLCEGGFNPFGIQPLSQACVDFVDEAARVSTEFTQKVLQGYVSGELFQLPAGPVTAVFGAERRDFDYNFDPGTLFGPIAGFNTAQPAGGTNSFTDFFGELNVPIAKDQPWAESAEINLQARHSKAEFFDRFPDDPEFDSNSSSSWAYGINGSWAPIHELRLRAAYQHSVRAPNFGELFAAGGGFPQIFDPCSVNTNFRLNGGAEARALCRDAGVVGGLGSRVDTFVATPGFQAVLTAVGNTGLKPEKGDTITLGAVFQKWGFTGSIDYYNIKVSDAIFAPDPNVLISACYGYHGLNPNLDANNTACTSVFRQGGDIAALLLSPANGGTPSYYFTVGNNGKFHTTGLDFQLAYRVPMDFLSAGARLDLNASANHVIKWERQELPGLTFDYAGTASFFGAGLGTSFPKWKGQLNAALNVKPFTFETRLRYIGGMDNRMEVIFPGEDFTGPDSIIYTDVAVQADIRNVTLRLGINNLFDLDPPTYSPNVQSGTDPSLYDVIGRRAYVQARVKF
jgi:outer membrane receptor protein involved in Fe transport